MDLFGGGASFSSPSQVLSRLVDGESDACVYVLTGREEAGLRLVACENSRTWTALLTPANLSGMARQVGSDTQEFTDETERALSGQPRPRETFVYSVAHNPEGLQLYWKRHLLPDNIKFQLGSVLLKEEEAGPTITLLLEHAVSISHSLHGKISELQRANTRLADERKIALERLEQAIHSKEQVEKELYSKFKLVLNEKKNKIRRLMEGIVSSTAATAIDDDEDEYASPDEDEATSLSTPPPPSAQSTLLGELDEISPPTKRRKRETRCRGTKEPDIPKRPTIPCPQTKTVKEPQLNSSADGDELLGLL